MTTNIQAAARTTALSSQHVHACALAETSMTDVLRCSAPRRRLRPAGPPGDPPPEGAVGRAGFGPLHQVREHLQTLPRRSQVRQLRDRVFVGRNRC